MKTGYRQRELVGIVVGGWGEVCRGANRSQVFWFERCPVELIRKGPADMVVSGERLAWWWNVRGPIYAKALDDVDA